MQNDNEFFGNIHHLLVHPISSNVIILKGESDEGRLPDIEISSQFKYWMIKIPGQKTIKISVDGTTEIMGCEVKKTRG